MRQENEYCGLAVAVAGLAVGDIPPPAALELAEYGRRLAVRQVPAHRVDRIGTSAAVRVDFGPDGEQAGGRRGDRRPALFGCRWTLGRCGCRGNELSGGRLHDAVKSQAGCHRGLHARISASVPSLVAAV